MSYEELDRVGVIERVIVKRVTQREAARMLGLTSRQVGRLRGAYEQDGAGTTEDPKVDVTISASTTTRYSVKDTWIDENAPTQDDGGDDTALRIKEAQREIRGLVKWDL